MIYDTIIIGSGPAGYAAGTYTSRASRNVLLFTGTMDCDLMPGGQLMTTTEVENYIGIESIDGFQLIENMKNQALKYGLQIAEKTIVRVQDTASPFVLTDNDGVEYQTLSVIIATGSVARRLHLPNESVYWNRGISACAVCDGALPRFRKKCIAVIGGGDSAMEEALFLSKYGSKVLIINRSSVLRASKIMIDRAKSNEKIEIIYNSQPVDVAGTDERGLTGLVVRNTVSDVETSLDIGGLFYAIGHDPNTKFLDSTLILMDESRHIVTEGKSTRTNVPGIFACGDVQDKDYRQAVVAAGSGVMAALDCEGYLQGL